MSAADHPIAAGGVLVIRPAIDADLPEILRLNTEWEHVTSRLDAEQLAGLHRQAAYHRIAEADGRVAAFLLALPPDVDYDSPNYRWFDRSRQSFLYIDRIVVGRAHQRAGLGAELYDDLLQFAAHRSVERLVCEVDIEPPNAASDAFHRRRGFVEVGTQQVALGAKRVSLREYVLG